MTMRHMEHAPGGFFPASPDTEREHFGNMFDAFTSLRVIAENGGDLRAWAEEVADLLGEFENFQEAWTDYQNYYTVDVPHRTLKLRPVDDDYGRTFHDENGKVYEHWQIRGPL